MGEALGLGCDLVTLTTAMPKVPARLFVQPAGGLALGAMSAVTPAGAGIGEALTMVLAAAIKAMFRNMKNILIDNDGAWSDEQMET